MKKENSKIKVIISIIALIILVIGATYAYFKDQIDKGKQTDIIVKSKTTDLLTFEIGDPISIEADQQSFASGKGNLYSESFAQANLIANNNTNEATANYNVYVLVNSNNYLYTQSDKRAEMLLHITDPDGNEVTSLDGFKHVSVTDATGTTLTGFDITTYKGLINVASNYEINSTSSTETTSQKWIFRVTFVNYDANQSENGNKEMFGKIIIQQETMENPTVADLCNEGEPLNKCIISLTNHDKNLFHLDGTFTDDSGNVTDVADGSYRYSGASEDVNNWICFGSEESTCRTENLFRIVGVFNENNHNLANKDLVKIMRYQPYGEKQSWNTNGTKVWKESTSYQNLIGYLDTLDTKYTSMLENVYWRGNGLSAYLSLTGTQMYYYEIKGALKENDFYNNIGLIYASDYYYAVLPEHWGKTHNILSQRNGVYNWMFEGNYCGWTITANPLDVSFNYAWYYCTNSGALSDIYVNSTTSISYLFPTFYLKETTKYVSGTGTKSNPFRIS